jgi:hypothetical protein
VQQAGIWALSVSNNFIGNRCVTATLHARRSVCGCMPVSAVADCACTQGRKLHVSFLPYTLTVCSVSKVTLSL